jgi:hypothetical protein
MATLEIGMNLIPGDELEQIVQRGIMTRREYLMEHEGERDERGS